MPFFFTDDETEAKCRHTAHPEAYAESVWTGTSMEVFLTSGLAPVPSHFRLQFSPFQNEEINVVDS